MKKLLILLFLLPLTAFSQTTTTEFKTANVKQTYRGDTIKQYFDTDTAKFYTDKAYFQFNKPIKGATIDSGTFSTHYYTQNAITAATTGKVSYIGSYNASVGTFPTTGQGGGAIKKGDYWSVSVEGTIGGILFTVGSSMIAKIDVPGQIAANWDIQTTSVPAVARTAGDVGEGYLKYSGTTLVDGQLFGGNSNPTGTKIGGFNGEFRVSKINIHGTTGISGAFYASGAGSTGVLGSGITYGVRGVSSAGYAGYFESATGIPLYIDQTAGNTSKMATFYNSGVEKASIDYTGKLTANGFVSNEISSINSSGNGIPLTINNNSTYNSLVINSSNSSGQAIKMEHHSTNTSDFISCIKNSAVKASIDHTGKLTANGADFGTRTAAGTHVQLVNSSTGQGFYLGNSTTGQGMQINNYGTGLGLNLFNTSSGIGLQLNNSSIGQGIYINQTNNGTPFQIDSASNVRAKFEPDGTLVFSGNATCWNDLQFPFTTAKLTGTSDPTFSKITDNGSGSTGIYAYSFSPTVTNEVFVGKEMDHEYKEGSNEYIHYHIYPSDNTAGNVVLFCEYVTNNIDAVLGNSTLVTVTVPIPANSAKKQIVVDIATITGTGLKISHGVSMRCGRLGADAADTYTGAIWITRAAVHYEIDMLGSRTQKSK